MKIGFILKSNKNHLIVVIPYYYIPFLYKKTQIKLKKYRVLKYKIENILGDLIILSKGRLKLYNRYKSKNKGI